MHDVLKQIGLLGIVPVIAIEDANDAEPLAQALIDGGLPCAEVTFRTAAAKDAISRIAKKFPDMALGAGTVLTVDQVKAAVDCGAKYIISPGLNPKTVEYCVANGIPVTPGVATPSEVEQALGFGLEVVKFFPAEQAGGLPFLKAMSAPYKQVKFIPTGGIEEKNLLSYLMFPSVLACGGSWMVKTEMISAKQFEQIRLLTEQAVKTMLGFQLRHVGFNMETPEEALAVSNELAALTGMPVKEGTSSNFVGMQFEVMKKKFLGTHGHLAIGTNFIERAMAYMERRGYAIRHETRYEKNGKLASVYLEQEIGGFALHLLQL
ncbi:MAG: bifunctional 4-hydroxy-2-oxoglutarate aldolase/2-dehydro-3-deoxy-phosphogluconate aldolase [Acidobacteriota bacterium]